MAKKCQDFEKEIEDLKKISKDSKFECENLKETIRSIINAKEVSDNNLTK